MKVLVTGADGLLGSMICRRLLEQGYEVDALILKNSPSKTIDGINVRKIEGNILDSASLDEAMQGQEYVIHVAANTSVWPRKDEFVYKVNLDGTNLVKEACQKHNIKRMVVISSASMFAPGTLEEPGGETGPFSMKKYGMDYINSKYDSCIQLQEAYKSEGLPVIFIAPTFMIGPLDQGPSSGKLIVSYCKNELPGYTSGGKNFVYTGDVADLSIKALKEGELGEVYIAGGHNLSYRDFFKMVSERVNKPFKMKKVPSFVVLTFGFINSALARVFRFKPKVSYGIARISLMNQYYSISKSQKAFNYVPTPLEQAIDESYNWFTDNGYI